MKRLTLKLATLYADLVQSATFSTVLPGSVFTQTINGRVYLYATEKHGATRVQRYLGPVDAPDAIARADDIRRAGADAKVRRKTVSMLKRAGVPAPTLAMGRLMEGIANAGLFRNGIVLVGTGAYQVYSPVVEAALSHAALSTQDADLAAASLAVTSEVKGQSLLDVLKRTDPTFIAQPNLNPRDPPRRFRSAAGFEVDVVTRYRTRADEERAVVIPGLQCSAQPLRYLDYLIADPVSAVALYGSCVPVVVPQAARYAVHKLIVAQVRATASAKRRKDLVPAKELIEVLSVSEPHAIDDAIANARTRGAKWKTNIDRSLKELGLDSFAAAKSRKLPK